VFGSVFRMAIVTLRAETDPTLALQGALQPPKANGRAAITDEKKFGQLLVAIDEYDGWPTLKAALQFLTLTCVRPGEVRGATRDEFDREKAVWHIPAERMKMRAPHDVPLSKQVLRKRCFARTCFERAGGTIIGAIGAPTHVDFRA
jgi:integrase